MIQNTYSTGTKVYNGGSNAATTGTVNPSGYIERSLNKPSQTRSGLAQAALNRLQLQKQKVGVAKSTPTKAVPNSGGKKPVRKFFENGKLVGRNPLIKSTTTGKLTNTKPRVLPFDYDLESKRVQESRSLNDFLSALSASENDAQQGFFTQKRYLDDDYRDTLRSVLTNRAASGMAYSSGYLNDMTRTNAAYNDASTALSAQNTSIMNNIKTQRGNAQTGYNEVLEMLNRENAARASARAAEAKGASYSGFKPPASAPAKGGSSGGSSSPAPTRSKSFEGGKLKSISPVRKRAAQQVVSSRRPATSKPAAKPKTPMRKGLSLSPKAAKLAKDIKAGKTSWGVPQGRATKTKGKGGATQTSAQAKMDKSQRNVKKNRTVPVKKRGKGGQTAYDKEVAAWAAIRKKAAQQAARAKLNKSQAKAKAGRKVPVKKRGKGGRR